MGLKLRQSLKKLTQANVDTELINQLLKEISTALLESDIHITLVAKLRNECLNELNELKGRGNTVVRRDVQRVIFNALTRLVDPGVEAPKIIKGNY